MTAYADLSTERRFDTGSIPWTSAMLYAAHKGLEHDVADLMWDVVNRMDMADRQWTAQKTKQATQQGRGNND